MSELRGSRRWQARHLVFHAKHGPPVESGMLVSNGMNHGTSPPRQRQYDLRLTFHVKHPVWSLDSRPNFRFPGRQTWGGRLPGEEMVMANPSSEQCPTSQKYSSVFRPILRLDCFRQTLRGGCHPLSCRIHCFCQIAPAVTAWTTRRWDPEQTTASEAQWTGDQFRDCS